MKYLLYIFSLFIITTDFTFSQEDSQIGSNINQLRQSPGAFYDYSDPEAVNIKVSVWGFVRYPGKYIIPYYSNAYDLLSYSGGPEDDANLDELRIFRISKDSVQSFIKLDYNDFLWNEKLTSKKQAPQLLAGDILLVPGQDRLYFRDYLTLTLSIFSVLISLAILVINIVK
jgi:protein involved in polysaccharide export with SLBB domain